MATTGLIPKVGTGTPVEAGRSSRDFPTDELVTMALCERRPAAVWEVAAQLGEGCFTRAMATLDRLIADGILTRFRAGLSHYYAPPGLALTWEGPGPGTIVCHSLKSLVLDCRQALLRLLWRRL